MVAITNTKGAVVDTGISLDNMPYLMALALTFIGGLGFISKKRKEEELF
ncbi:MAG: LPXTG cell wall anchor domain-containing protein [Lachnospiraceae bacterium]|nr:LPXTG cell wall anchor domain-containing protein [Lachnospiraceae bacterium]